LGLTVATFSTGVLSQTWDWRSPFWVWGTVGLILFAYFAATMIRHKIGFYVHPVASVSEAVNGRRNISVGSAFAVLAAVSSITTTTFILFTGYMPLYFNIAEQLSPGASATMVAAWIGIGVFAGFVTGRLVKRFGGESRTLRAMFAIEFLLFLIAYMSSVQTTSLSSWRVIRSVAIVLTGIPVFVTFPAVNGLLGLRMPHKRLGLTYAINLSLGLLAASLVTYFTGYLASVMTMGVMLPLLLIFAAVGTMVSLIL
jgi:predicted MFS family arabinose efflux permease